MRMIKDMERYIVKRLIGQDGTQDITSLTHPVFCAL